MVVGTMKRGFAQRIVAIALFARTPLAFAALPFLAPRDGRSEAGSIPAGNPTPAPIPRASMQGTPGDTAMGPTSRLERVERGSG